MKELIKKIGGFSIGPIIGALIGFITVPVITYFISPEEYGKTSMFTLAQGTVSMLVYLGMDQAFVREFHVLKDNIDKLIVNAVTIPVTCAFIIDIVILVNKEHISTLLFSNKNEAVAVYALIVLLPFMVVENFALLKIRMEEKGIQYSFFTILLKLLGLVFTILLFLFYEKSFRSVVYAMALAEIINGLVLYIVSMRKIQFKLQYLNRQLIITMLLFGLPLIPAYMLNWALSSMDKIMLRAMCNYEALGLYTAAFKIVSALGILQTCFTLFWTPVAYRWYESNKENSSFTKVSEIISLLMIVMCLCLLLLKNIVALLLGAEFSEAIYIFPFLVLYPIMYTMSETTAVGIGFSRKTQYNILVSALSGGVNIGLNFLLIPIYQSTGAAIATGVSYIVFFWARTIIARKLWWKFPVGKYIFYTIIIIINCVMHTFVIGYSAYIVSTVSLLLVLLLNFKMMRRYYNEFTKQGSK